MRWQGVTRWNNVVAWMHTFSWSFLRGEGRDLYALPPILSGSSSHFTEIVTLKAFARCLCSLGNTTTTSPLGSCGTLCQLFRSRERADFAHRRSSTRQQCRSQPKTHINSTWSRNLNIYSTSSSAHLSPLQLRRLNANMVSSRGAPSVVTEINEAQLIAPRNYQLEMLEASKKGNIIVVVGFHQ